MATIVHRRPAARLGPEAPRGPGGSFDSLTWVGYASLVAAFGFLVFGLRPLAEMGDPRTWDWTQVLPIVASASRAASVVVLPAALEFGVPGARRLTPWLMRGTVLLALEQLLQPALSAARSAYVDSQALEEAFSYATLGWIALTLVGFALTLVGIAGAWSLSDGLADAGGRVRRSLLAAIVLGGTILVGVVYVPMLAITSGEEVGPSESVLLVSNIASILLSFADNALWLAIGARLIAGLVAGRRPRRAWVIGGLAGAFGIVLRLTAPVLFSSAAQLDPLVSWLYLIVGTVVSLLLAIGFAMGVGRGRERRRPPPRRLHLFVLDPTT